MTSLHSPHADSLLQALQYQGTSNDCGPYTTATVINALNNLNLNAGHLADEMDRPVWRGPLFVVRRVPNWATFPWGMVDVFRQYGLSASWGPLSNPEYLMESLESDRVLMPIIGSWRPLWAHVMTLVAWDEGKGWGFANTQLPHHNTHWFRDEVFRRQWGTFFRILIEVKPK